MIHFLARHFIKDSQQTGDPKVRRAWGALCGGVGILLNLLLCAGKLAAGAISGSIAATADAFNNLSDALSSLIALMGFWLSARRPDRDHPYGHRRYEYIAGLIVSLAILLMGLDLAVSCARRILAPEPVAFDAVSAAILGASVLVKLYMALYNRAVGRDIDSPTLRATALDSLCDAAATSAVLASLLLSRALGLNIDAWTGAAVSLLVLWAGVRSARETISPLLGRAPDPEFVRRVEAIVRDCPEVLGMHDLMVHDYGAGRSVISLHAEVRAEGELMALHEAIDRVERRLHEELNCTATIHIDPVATGGEAQALRARMEARIREELGEGIALHDFREDPLRFDAALPYESPLSDEEALAALTRLASEECPGSAPVITIDRR